MNQKGGTYWLASYPKSGNTWVRTLITVLCKQTLETPDINSIGIPIASSKELIEQVLGIEIDELSIGEIDHLRPLVHKNLASFSEIFERSRGKPIVKTHDAYHEKLFPASYTAGAIVIVRNPLDIAVSYANHSKITLTRSAKLICSGKHFLCDQEDHSLNQAKQKLMSWSHHVSGWVNADIRRLIIRYEDLHQDPLRYFSDIIQFLGWEFSKEYIEQAIKQCEFDKLQRLENDHGFYEKIPGVKNFFNEGKIGSWQCHLPPKQIQNIIDCSRETMYQLGYIDDQDQPLLSPAPIRA